MTATADAVLNSMPHFTSCYNIFMFRSKSIRWMTVILILIAISPAITFAQLDKPIVPCNPHIDSSGTMVDPCTFCHIAQLAQNVLNTGIYIAIFLSALLFAYAGVKYISAGGEPGKATEAKSIFWHVGVGLLLILAAWLIVDMIMGIMLGREVLVGPWNEIC